MGATDGLTSFLMGLFGNSGESSGKSGKKNKPKKTTDFKKKSTVQQTIPYDTVYPNGIIETAPGRFSKTYQLDDVNFKTAQQSVQERMFLDYETLLNTLTPGMVGQVNIFNRSVPLGEVKSKVLIKPKNDGLNDFRDEYNNILLDKMTEGTNNLTREKFFTINLPADNIQIAANTFNRIDMDVNSKVTKINNSQTSPMSLNDRLHLLYDIFNDADALPYNQKVSPILKNDNIDLAALNRMGLSSKDFIAPDSFKFSSNYFMMGEKYGRTYYLDHLPTFMNADILSDLSSVPCNMLISCTFRPIPPQEASKMVAHQITAVNGSIVNHQMHAAKSGYSSDILPAELQRAREQANAIREDMQSRNQKLFFVTVLITVLESSKELLEEKSASLETIIKGYLCSPTLLISQQEAAFNTCLPLGNWDVKVDRTLTTEQSSLFIPFSVQELSQEGGRYYGINAISKNLILYDRTTGDNPNGLIFGKPGSGKSFIAKLEMIATLLNTVDDEIYVIDPEGEYFPLVKAFGGQVIKISNNSQYTINPLDMDAFYGDEDDPVASKCDFLTTMCETIIGHNALDPIMVSEIQRCGRRIYKSYWEQMEPLFAQGNVTIDTTKMPTLVDFWQELASSKSPHGQYIASALEPYCTGNYDVFAHQTNVDTKARFVVYDISSVAKQSEKMKEFALQICVDNIWNKILSNKKKQIRTWFYIDEFHILMKSQTSANYLLQVYRRARKYKGVPTGITQNVADMLVSETSSTILNTCNFLLIMKQSSDNREAVAARYNVSEELLEYISDGNRGSGLLYNGKTIIPWINEFPQDSHLYKIISTNPNEKKSTDEPEEEALSW